MTRLCDEGAPEPAIQPPAEGLIAQELRPVTSMTAHPHLTLVRTRLPRLDPVTCLPWCRHGDGPPGEWHPLDQRCDSAHPGVSVGDEETVGAYASFCHAPGEGTPRVAVYVEVERGCMAYLTRAQALALAEEIRAAAMLLPADDEGGAA